MNQPVHVGSYQFCLLILLSFVESNLVTGNNFFHTLTIQLSIAFGCLFLHRKKCLPFAHGEQLYPASVSPLGKYVQITSHHMSEISLTLRSRNRSQIRDLLEALSWKGTTLRFRARYVASPWQHLTIILSGILSMNKQQLKPSGLAIFVLLVLVGTHMVMLTNVKEYT